MKIAQSSIGMDTMTKCNHCHQHRANHTIWSKQTGHIDVCCACYLRHYGGRPADWHHDCLRVYGDMEQERKEQMR